MGLLDGLKAQAALWKWRRTPLGQALAQHTQTYFYSGTTLSHFDEASKKRLIEDFGQKVLAVSQSRNAVHDLRELLANYVLAFAALQVLCLTEAEKAGAFYKGNPYISGELHAHIERAAELSEELSRIRFESSQPLSATDLVAVANQRCALLLYYANGLNMVRITIGDKSPRDWFKPFVEAMLVWEEASYREKLGLPRLTPGFVDHLAYSNFLNYVTNGAPSPYYEWSKAWPELYLTPDA